MPKKLTIILTVVTGLFTAILQAQDVVALPGANSTGQTVAVQSVNPFAAFTSLTAGAGSFTAIAKPDGSKYYIVANSGSQGVTVVDAAFSNPHALNLNQPATAAAITPDGGKLVVAAGTVHVFDTSNDFELVPGGIQTGVNVYDVAISLDGSFAYLLGADSLGGSHLSVIDLTSNTPVSGFLGFTGLATGLSVAPNGRLYISMPNRILEINPLTWTTTPGGTLRVNARVGKLVYTPDGRYALAVNTTPATGQAVLLIDLAAHTVANFVPAFNVVLDSLLVASNSTVYAYSAQQQSLYQITIGTNGSLNIGQVSLPPIPSNSVTAVALSSEVAGGGRSTVQHLFIASGGTLYRMDLVQNQITGQILLNAPAGALSYVTPATTTGLPSTLLSYGSNQTVAPNGTSLPLVVRVLDGQGRPLSGVTIAFSTVDPGTTVSPDTAITGSSGYALTYLTAPATTGTVSVTATDRMHIATFTVSVASVSINAAGIAIVAGQGQLVSENVNSGLTVKLTDINGDPVPGVSTTFTVASGTASFAGGASTTTVLTDSNGLATATLLSGTVLLGTGFVQSTINASAQGTAVVPFYVTATAQSSPPIIQFIKPQPGDSLSGQAGSTIANAFVARISVAPGIAIPNVSIRANSAGTNQLPSAMCADPSGMGVLSDGGGTATCNLLLNGKPGTTQISTNIGYFQDSFSVPLTITSGPPAGVTILQGNNQSGKPGQQLPLALVVTVNDAFGNTLTGLGVNWQVLNPDSVTLSNVISITDGSGRASALATLGNTPGIAQVKVTSGSFSATFTLTVNIAAAGLRKISGDGQSTVVKTRFASRLVVAAVDGQGNAVTGAQVIFTVTGGSATVDTPMANTDASGQASTGVTAGASAGNITITAASSGFTVTFALTSRVPGPRNIAFLNGASFQAGLAPGAIVTITGAGIAPGVQGVVTPLNLVGQLPVNLAGVSILFNGIPAPIFYVANVNGSESVAIQVPFEVQPGTVNVTINAADGSSTTVSAQVQPYSPGVFTNTYGTQQVAVTVRPDGSYVSPSNPALRGEIIRVFVTGLGQVTPATGTNQAGISGQDVVAPLVIGLNNQGVPLISAQYAPGQIGVYVIKFQVPKDTQAGPGQPFGLIVTDAAGNAYFAQNTNIPIQ